MSNRNNASNSRIKRILALLLLPLYISHIIVFYLSGNKSTILADLEKYYDKSKYVLLNLLCALIYIAEFRALFYYRIGKISYCIKWIHPIRLNLYFHTSEIGKGLKIQHGFATIIAAKKIGKNCWINQQVTIGYTNNNDCPVIGDNVKIGAGAIVIGNISIGNDAIIGAGTVVTKNVPANSTIVGNPAHIIKLDGRKVYVKL